MMQDDLIRREDFARCRDPLSARVGYHFGDKHGCVPCQFKWFDSVSHLRDHILDVDLPLCEYDRDAHDQFRTGLTKALARVDVEGLSEQARHALNAVDWDFTVYWWGTFQDLVSGETQFSREILTHFFLEKRRDRRIEAKEMPAFLEYLRNSCESNTDSGIRLTGRDSNSRPSGS